VQLKSDQIEHFDARLESALREAMDSPHDPDCYWNTVDPEKPVELLDKLPPCQCRKALKIRFAARSPAR
jgi:hypothetical protein